MSLDVNYIVTTKRVCSTALGWPGPKRAGGRWQPAWSGLVASEMVRTNALDNVHGSHSAAPPETLARRDSVTTGRGVSTGPRSIKRR